MPTPAQRFQGWIESLSTAWRDRFGGWLSRWLTNFLTDALEDMLPEQKAPLQAALQTIIDDENTPPYIRQFLEHSTDRGSPLMILAAILILPMMLIPMVTGAFQPLGNLWVQKQERLFKTFRLDPHSVITAWRRDPTRYPWLFDDLKDQGINEERQEVLKLVTQAYPSLRDVIGFYAHEVFEPDMITRYGLDEELPPYEGTLFEKLGVSREVALQYWMDHWVHANWIQVMEMLHRGEMTEEDVKQWFRLVEIPPFWRQKLINTSWSVPNRIEIRMMARYLDLPKTEVMELLKKAGLHKDYRSDAADFMIIMGLTGYWSAMLSKGWMTPDQVKADIDSRGFRPVTAERIYKSLVKASSGERVDEGKAFTKTEIYKGVKTGILTWDEGVELLTDLGYTREEAEYLLTINVGVLTGSPESYAEFKDITTKYRIAIGAEAKPMPEELIAAGKALVLITREVEALEARLAAALSEVVDEEALSAENRQPITDIRVALNRTRAELERIRADYQAKLAEWKRGV